MESSSKSTARWRLRQTADLRDRDANSESGGIRAPAILGSLPAPALGAQHRAVNAVGLAQLIARFTQSFPKNGDRSAIEVVGINTAIATDAQNIGFAIPIDTIKRVIPILVSGNPERGWFGASARPASPGEAAELGHSNPSAVIIDDVIDLSPASQAGVRVDDLVLRVGDQEIPDFIAFRRQLISLRPGNTLALTILRDGEQIKINSTLVTPPSR